MTQQYIATSPDQLATPDQLRDMSGLEIMRAILDGKLAGAPIAGPLNYRLDTVEEGFVTFRGAPGFEMSNPMGTVHGGWYGTLLDSAMGCAVMTCLPAGAAYTTLEYKINITRPIPHGMEIIATSTVQHAGRSTAVANGEIRGAEDGRLYATGSTTCIILQPR